MWIMAMLAAAMETCVLGYTLISPTYFSIFLVIDGAILATGMWLMLYAVYPGNLNHSSIFKEPHIVDSPRAGSDVALL